MNIEFVKKISIVASISFATLATQAQNIDEAIKLYKYKRYESAKKIFEPLATTNPLAYYYLGLSELELENVAGAKAIFSKSPEDAACMSGLARILFVENKVSEANALLQKVIAKAKKKDFSPYVYAADAITYTKGGNYQQAVEWYKKAQELGKTGDTYFGLSDAYRKIQDGGGQAMTNLEYAEETTTEKSLANYKMGNLYYAAKIYEAALEKYKKASDLDPQNPLPFRDLANAYYKTNKYELAKENIKKYLALSDNATEDQINYANILYLSKDYTGAISKMQELINKGAEKPYMYRIIGFSQMETGDNANAAINMDKFFAKQDASKINPVDYINYGKILMKTPGKETTAAPYFQKGIDKDTTTDKSAIYRELGTSYKDYKDYKIAATWYKKVLESNSTTIDANDYWWTGVMHYYNKDYSNAEVIFNQMVEKFPTEPTGFYWKAKVTAAQDNGYKTGAAAPHFSKWLGMITETDESKKANIISAYTYLAMTAYNKKDKETALLYAKKIQTLDANDDTAKQLVNFYANPVKETPAPKTEKPKAPAPKKK